MKYPKITSASAGSGKTYKITKLIYDKISSGEVSPDKIIATTFTVKAANELKARIREKLIEEGKTKEANLMNEALIGTINSVCLKLLKKYAFHAGISPDLETLDENDQKVIIREILGTVTDDAFLEVANKLYQTENNGFNIKVAYYIKHIEKIISELRSNNLHPDQLESFGQNSVYEFINLYKGTIKEHDIQKARILELIEEAIDQINLDKIDSDNAKKQLSKVKEHYRSLKNNNFIWDDWRSISQIKLKKTAFEKGYFDSWIVDLKVACGNLFDNELFRKEYELYILNCFTYAKEIIKGYEMYKSERGLLDFTDQEAKIHQLIHNNDQVIEDIQNSYKLIVVDEFQDVSPLQLSIFLRLTQIVEENIWVGDPKQSIYAFRGADPKLMNEVVMVLPTQNKSQLKHSYRSRAALLHFSNSIFSKAFEDSMDEEAIILQQGETAYTKRDANEENILSEAINYWNLKGSGNLKNDYKHETIAIQIQKLLASEQLVFDKGTAAYRKIQFGDISILCRKNSICKSIGNAISRAGIPVAAAGSGLTEEPEIILLSALLKLLIFPSDSLAKAEILLYSKYQGDQSIMIEDRLRYENNYEWGLDNRYIKAIKEVRSKSFDFSPIRAIEVVLSHLNLEELFSSWGNIKQRITNIDAFLLHAKEYQEMCNRLSLASSIAGFLNWMIDLNNSEEDTKGTQSGDVVQIMTYHQSKGLEWPIVILWELDNKERDRFYNVNIVTQSALDVSDPLKDRELRLNVLPYNGTSSYNEFDEVIDKSEQKTNSYEALIQEEKRLLYVAITRARDYLYFCSFNKNFNIPNLVNLEINKTDLEDGFYPAEIKWKEKEIGIRVSHIEVSKENDLSIFSGESIHRYFAEKTGRKTHDLFKINASHSKPIDAIIGKIIDINTRKYIDKTGISDTELGHLLHDLICVYQPSMESDQMKHIIRNYVQENKYNELVDKQWILEAIQNFYTHLYNLFDILKIYKELPIQSLTNEGNYINGYIDMLIETENGLTIIDHKTFSTKDYSECTYAKKAREYSGQLKIYEDIISASMEKKVIHKFIYFVFEGKMFEVIC